MSYYDPFLAEWLLGGSGETLAKESVGLLDDLNNILSSDYGAADTADVAGAFKSADFSPGGRYPRDEGADQRGPDLPLDVDVLKENIHANDAGHARIAKAFEKIVMPLLAADRHRRS